MGHRRDLLPVTIYVPVEIKEEMSYRAKAAGVNISTIGRQMLTAGVYFHVSTNGQMCDRCRLPINRWSGVPCRTPQGTTVIYSGTGTTSVTSSNATNMVYMPMPTPPEDDPV